MNYKMAPEVEEVGKELIREYHKELMNVRVEFIFAENVPQSGGRDLWGRARKITGLNALFAGKRLPEMYDEEPEPFFVVEVAEPIWIKLEEPGRRALVDHELMHCGVDVDTGKLSIRPHYIEEFPQIIRRHGLWKGDVEVFALASAEQLSLLENSEDDSEDRVGSVLEGAAR